MKVCTKCNKSLPLTCFYKHFARCKSCVSVERKAHYIAKRQEILDQKKAQYIKDKNKKSLYNKQYRKDRATELAEYYRKWRNDNTDRLAKWREENKDRRNAETRAHRKQNKHLAILQTQKRRAIKASAASQWEPEFDRFVFEEAALLAKQRERLFGFQWHVDHIVPLKAKEACGLHNAYNVAVTPWIYNLRKNNRLVGAEFEQWPSVSRKISGI